MADEVYYHVTRTANLPKIAERGIVGMQPTNFVNPSGQRLGELGKIYAFSDYKDAVQFASEMDWQAHGDLGTGKVSIIAHKPGAPGGNPWETDPDTQLFQKSGLRAQRRVPIEDILGAEPVDMSLIKNLSEGGGSIDPPTTRLQPLIKGVAVPDEKDLIDKLDHALTGMLSGWDEPALYGDVGVEDDAAVGYFDEAFDQAHDPNINPRHRLSMGGWSDRDIDDLAEAFGGEQELNEALENRYEQRREKVRDFSPEGTRKARERAAREAGKALKFGRKAGLKAIPLAGLAAEFADIPEAEAGTMGSEFESAPEARARQQRDIESEEFLAEQPGYEPEGTSPAWADPEWEKQRRFGDEPEEEADYSPEGTRKSRDAAAKKAMEK